MASKLALTAALLVALVTLATSTTYTTTVTTTTIEDEANPQQCQQQIQGRQFRSCQRYLSQRRQYNEDEDSESVLEMSTDIINPEQQYLRDCCQQLRGVSQQCRCQAIRHAVRQQQQQHQHGGSQQGQQMQQVYQKAKNLPQRCQFQQPQQCDIRVIFV